MGWIAGVQFLAGASDFSLLHSAQAGSGADSASYPMGTGGSFPRGKGHEADSSPPSSAEVRNGGAIPPFHHMSSWHNA
jgi:hypothetical protein